MGVTTQVPQWYDEFESVLDGMLGVLRPDWRLPEPPAHVAQRPEAAPRWRTNVKRGALAKHLRAHPDEIRNHQAALLHIVVHDLNASFNEFLILPIIEAIGHRAVHEAIIEYMAGGSFTEQVGAVQAWYTAQPGLHYRTPRDRDRGDPTEDSALRYSEWLEVLPRYRAACERAIERCDDSQKREYLKEITARFSEAVSFGEQPQP